MSRSKDCRKGGVRIGNGKSGKGAGFEFSGKRCPRAEGNSGPFAKRVTHRHERRDRSWERDE